MIYERIRSTVITAIGEMKIVEISVVLHQGSALRPLLFVLFLDVLSEGIRNEELWEFLYAEDLMTTAENEDELQRRVVELQETLEVGGLRVNVKEPEVMVFGIQELGVMRALEEPVRGISSERKRIRWRDKGKDDIERRGLVEEETDKIHQRGRIRQTTP
ncbi:uncharacterized protein [Palaemon carinicauda]|uniref:uncharacterized protein n=1 Tax=Palaemon carinicauda TaxID=392227 RepID=UPI0035B5A8ED